MFDLRSYIARAPRAKKLRLKMADGEERMVDVRKGGKHIWEDLVATIKNSDAVAIECLGEDGVLLRGRKLTDDDDGGETFEADGSGSKDLSKAMREQAAMLDAYGRRMNEAFERGSEAASTSQDKLVALVEVLTQHLTLAITNLHNVSSNYAQVVAAAGTEGEGGNAQQMLAQFLGSVMAGKLGPAPAEAPQNGQRKK
jgi:hypothetical protein